MTHRSLSQNAMTDHTSSHARNPTTRTAPFNRAPNCTSQRDPSPIAPIPVPSGARTTRARLDESCEWLETDGLGGFAMGTAPGVRTRRYHSLLTTSLGRPTDRVALVKGFDAWIETPDGTYALSSQRYAGGHTAPDGVAHLVAFDHDPWPRWEYRLPDGLRVIHELVMTHGAPTVALSWRLVGATEHARLVVRPLLSGMSIHTLHAENREFRFDVRIESPTCLSWQPYAHLPEIFAVSTNGGYAHDPVWYRGLWYAEEARRGFDAHEDLGSPGVFRWDLSREDGVLILSGGQTPDTDPKNRATPIERLRSIQTRERARRESFESPLQRAASAFVVRRGEGRTIIAGYPWFGDWGRDTFIALRGLSSAGTDTSLAILTEWAGTVSQGMIPNRFADEGDEPEFNSVDASLWFVIAAGEHLDASESWNSGRGHGPTAPLRRAILEIVQGYAAGTRYGIGMNSDGLLAAGEPGQQLTWMDARVDGREMTPRVGKPVEVQALWINALRFASRLDSQWRETADLAVASFRERFWTADRSCLHDVVDVDHRQGACDPTLRPNQIFAVGGLPIAVLEGEQARAVVDMVERELLTPTGLRSLARWEPGYRPSYEGGPSERDGAYHTGTVWPWLMGAFVEAWVRVRGCTPEAAGEARRRFIEPMLMHMDEGGLGSVSEIFDAEAPRRPGGCPFQAWSVGELLRAMRFLDRVKGAGPS